MANNILNVYKLIAKNNKLIKEKVKLNSVSGDWCIIQTNNLIQILKDILSMGFLTRTQWRMIVSLVEGYKVGLVDYNIFIKIIKLRSKISKSYKRIRIN